MRNDVFMEGVRTFLGLKSHILEPFADGNHFIGRAGNAVDGYGIAVKNANLVGGDYIRMHSRIQTVVMDMLKMAKVYAVREPQNMFHGLVRPDYLKTYCQQITGIDSIVPDIMTFDHPTKQRNGKIAMKRRILEVKTIRADTGMNIYNPGRPKRRGVDKKAGYIQADYLNRCKRLDEGIAPGDQARPFTAAYKSYGEKGVDQMVIGNFGEVNAEFKKFVYFTALLAGSTEEAANMTPAGWTDVGRSDATKLIRKRFKVALGCMAVRAQNEILLKRVQYIRNSKEAATAAACNGPTRGYFNEYGNSTFNDRENADAYGNFRSYNNSFSHESDESE
jgi:hypothetical protein